MVYKTAGAGREKLLRGKAVVLLGNPKTGRIAVTQDDYYWLAVTSCLSSPPCEAHHCRTCEGGCVEQIFHQVETRKFATHFSKDTHHQKHCVPEIEQGFFT